MSEVRGSGQEYQTATVQEPPRGAAPCPRYPCVRGQEWRREESPHALKPEARGSRREELPHAPTPEAKDSSQEEQPHTRGQGWWPGGPTPRPRSRGYTGAGGPRGAVPR